MKSGSGFSLSQLSSDSLHKDAGLQWHDVDLWRGDRCLQRGLNGHLQPGHAITLRGPNGCGKTTLIRTLCGLSETEQGDIRWNGRAIAQQRSVFNGALAYAGHRSGLKAELTARENLRFAARLSGTAAPLEPVLTALQLDSCADLPLANLSAGQHRRVTLARVLNSGKALWVFDEPFTNLDQAGRDWLSEQFARHLDAKGMLLLAAHQQSGIEPGREMVIELRGTGS